MNPIRVRFAPSPTGYLHIGGLRTALYDFLFARHHGGTFILRIEDTDRSRYVEGAVENLIHTLRSLDLEVDEGPGIGGDYGPYVQSERLELYRAEARRLLDSGDAYHCFCTPETLSQMREEQQKKGEFVKYDRRCRALSKAEVQEKLKLGESHVIRLKMPDNHVFRFHDLIRGEVEMDADQSDDQVLIKSDGFPTYHLAAVVDDHHMKISHVIRGEEWLSSTPKHIWLNQCLGWEAPLWVHLPLILNPDRSKLSKRMNDVSVESYLQKGYLKEALLNFVALLGWHSADDRETYSLGELSREFTLERVSKSGAVFDIAKLDWMNGWYLRNMPLPELVTRCLPWFQKAGMDNIERSKLFLIVAAARERCTLLPEIPEYAKIFVSPRPLSEKEVQMLKSEDSKRVLQWFLNRLPESGTLDQQLLDDIVKGGMEKLQLKGKAYYTPLRLALIHQPHGPDLPTTFGILGLEEAHRRLQNALEI